MNTAEAIEFFSNQAGRAERGILVAQSTRNYQLFALNSGQLFKSQLMCALSSWRQGEDARQLMTLAVENLGRNAQALSELDVTGNSLLGLPLERAQIVSFLIDTPGWRESCGHEFTSADKKLDAALASLLISSRTSVDVEYELRELFKASALAADSYRLYFEILSLEPTGHEVSSAIEKAERNFECRARDPFYSGGDQTEGGGADNSLVLDYRLAAVLKKIQYVGPSIHRWSWQPSQALRSKPGKRQ